MSSQLQDERDEEHEADPTSSSVIGDVPVETLGDGGEVQVRHSSTIIQRPEPTEEQEFVEILVHKGKEDHKKIYENDCNRFSNSGEIGNSFSLKMTSSVNEKSRINRCQENIKYDV